ncbi:hypothetical protein [Bordetella sp. LUAb4]|uniref:VHL beta domain-containing protein n=1 Tax=Bordetella sp. LUAb4 TaxID=2843195 RepID=UPI001E57FCDB|nr:hypothetical protein [Bordetella sp. LUAb4]
MLTLINHVSGVLLAALLLVFSSSAAAFDCDAARNDAEKTICGNSDLSRLEDELSRQYEIALRDTVSPEILRQDERAWLSRRNVCRKDVHCLTMQYQQRLLELTSEDRGATRKEAPLSLPMLACSNEASLASIESSTSTEVTFLNDSDESITVYWLDLDGHRKQYQVLAAGNSYRQQTYLTHPWIVTTADGRCIGLYLPRAARGVAIVGSSPAR